MGRTKTKNCKSKARGNNYRRFQFFILFLFVFLGSHGSFAQAIKFKSTDFSYKERFGRDNWSNWEEWQEASVLIVVDIDNERISVYSKERQVYDVVEYEGEHYDKDNDLVYSFYCVDNSGHTCRVRLVKLLSENNQFQLYIDYDDFMVVYNAYSLN